MSDDDSNKPLTKEDLQGIIFKWVVVLGIILVALYFIFSPFQQCIRQVGIKNYMESPGQYVCRWASW
ncbi:MAG: hypothetical protein V6Z81_09485 [Parvularculales bacterium]